MKNLAALEVVMFTWDTWRSAASRHPLLWRVLEYLEVPEQSSPPFVACPTCAVHNKLTEERCSACGMALFE